MSKILPIIFCLFFCTHFNFPKNLYFKQQLQKQIKKNEKNVLKIKKINKKENCTVKKGSHKMPT